MKLKQQLLFHVLGLAKLKKESDDFIGDNVEE